MYVFLGDEIDFAVKDVLSEMEKILETSQDLFYKKDNKKNCLQTKIQTCLNYSFNDSLKQSIHKILMEHCFLAERISPGGFQETLKEVILLFFSKNESFNNDTFCPKFEDLNCLIQNFVNEKYMQDICFEAIKLAGFGGKITIEKSVNSTTSIEVIDGYSFKHKNLGLQSIKLVNPKILCIDGYIESVSEVNRLFQDAVESKHNIVLVARGMHDDVLNTIKVNRDRKTMFIYPVIINFDLSGINTIVDICVVSGLIPVSENSGDLISTTSLKNSNDVDEVSVIGDSLTIKNKKSKVNVKLHVKKLIEKRASTNSGVEDFLTSRIKSLSNNNVILRLPDDSSFIKNSQTVDYALRSVRSMLDYGVSFNNDCLTLFATINSSKELSKKFINQIKNVKAAIC